MKLGYVSPQTGPLAAFGEADKFVIDSFLATTKKMGLNYEVVVKDFPGSKNSLPASLQIKRFGPWPPSIR